MDLSELTGGDKPPTQTTEPAATPAPVAAPDPVVNPGDTAAPPAAADQDKLVPLSALDAERKGRKDWKEKALRIEGENALLKHQLEQAMKGPVSQPQPQAQQVDDFPDPILDPEGYRKAVRAEASNIAKAERLNDDEEATVEKHGKETVEAAFAALQEQVKTNPALWAEFTSARKPWTKLMKWAEERKVRDEIGDPVAYKEKLRADIRAELEAERNGQPAPTNPGASPPLNIPSSLATVPNIGNRSAPAYTGPSPLTDFVRTPRH